MLVVPGRLVYACPVVRHIFQVWGARVVQWWEYSPPTNVARFKSRRRRHMWVEFVVGSLPCSERFFSGYSGFPLSSKTSISKFQFDQESGGRRTTMWMCYLQIVIYFYLFIIYFTGLRVLVSFVPSVFLLRGVFQPVSPSPSPPCCSFFPYVFCFSVTSQVPVFCFLFCGSPWLGCAIVQAMGASFNLRAGCQKWKPLLDPLGTQLPSSDTVVNLC